MLAKVANKDTQTVVSALIKQAKTLPNELYKSLTWDRGKELADHRRFTLATDAVEKVGPSIGINALGIFDPAETGRRFGFTAA
jgi:hypothetical protein